MIKILTLGHAWTPKRFWLVVEIDPEKEPDRYTDLMAMGYIEEKSTESEPGYYGVKYGDSKHFR